MSGQPRPSRHTRGLPSGVAASLDRLIAGAAAAGGPRPRRGRPASEAACIRVINTIQAGVLVDHNARFGVASPLAAGPMPGRPGL